MSDPIFMPIEAPYDDHERYLIERINAIRREYEAAAKPYMDALVRSRSMKPVKYHVLIEPLKSETKT